MCIRDRDNAINTSVDSSNLDQSSSVINFKATCGGTLKEDTVSYTHLDVYKRQLKWDATDDKCYWLDASNKNLDSSITTGGATSAVAFTGNEPVSSLF